MFLFMFFMLLLSADFFQSQFLTKLLQDYNKNVKQFGSRIGPTVCLAYYGYNTCLQML